MTTVLYILAYFAIGFGGVGACVWWRPGWFYRWIEVRTVSWDGWGYNDRGEVVPEKKTHTTPAHWEMRIWWPLLAVAWPVTILYCVGAGTIRAGVWVVEAFGRTVTAKLDRLREIDQEVGAIKAERERLLKEAGL